jgi:uncharacterized protein YdaU (DUF1376 family)
MQPLPWFPFYDRDFFMDEKVKVMSNAQVGMYLRLLSHQWQEGSLPNDELALSRIALANPCEADELTTLVRACFVKNGRAGRLLNARLTQVKKEQEEKDQVNRDRARKGGLARSRQQAELKHDSSTAQGQPKLAESESESDPKTSSSVSQKKPSRKASAKRRSVLPEDFQPKTKHEEIAKGLGLNLAVEFTKFKDHHQSKGSLMLDWDAALRKWLRNAVEFRRPR